MTIFFKAKRLAGIVSIKSPAVARQSVIKIKNERGLTKRQKIGAMNLVAGRAKAQLARKNLSARERKEMQQVREIYRRGSRGV